MMKYIKNAREIGFAYFILKRGLDNIAYNISIDVLHAAVQTKQVLVTKQMGIYILHCLLRQ